VALSESGFPRKLQIGIRKVSENIYSRRSAHAHNLRIPMEDAKVCKKEEAEKEEKQKKTSSL
jgi:hypothetical protein